ncbi:MAG: Crp/Fnr family transcriptional regulator [Pseudobutyrivibrio sp.]|nr:Crp/Fnr family transcriptional regulator [Pseudobutyrivibrio sp.]
MKDMNQILSQCSLFDMIDEENYSNVLKCLNAHRKAFNKGETIAEIGDSTDTAGIVLDGKIEINFFDEDGNQINIRHIAEGEVFGAAQSCGAKAPINVMIRAIEDCDVVFMNFANLLQVQNNYCPYRAQVTANLLRDFAKRTVFLNQRMHIVCQKKLRDKIKVYLQTLGHDESGTFNLPFSRAEFADYLYVDRSALSRELSRMKSQGIIDYDGRTIRIIDDTFLN